MTIIIFYILLRDPLPILLYEMNLKEKNVAKQNNHFKITELNRKPRL